MEMVNIVIIIWVLILILSFAINKINTGTYIIGLLILTLYNQMVNVNLMLKDILIMLK